ncbi:hypothetical protein [Floricoccus penangensis]|uniref:hypothetical protein n=1 Tax=Floricoccus penangensis TaxID=1859475 RepID=UPI00204149A4|nr:hypothetical protein [Floricoccus penangensis]URZ87214.1 hypothetical protein KIW23_09040 [Floricoccus penangensis]
MTNNTTKEIYVSQLVDFMLSPKGDTEVLKIILNSTNLQEKDKKDFLNMVDKEISKRKEEQERDNEIVLKLTKHDLDLIEYELKRMFLLVNADLSKSTSYIVGEPGSERPYSLKDLQEDNFEALMSLADLLGLESLYLDTEL